jgi:hypothetical protein
MGVNAMTRFLPGLAALAVVVASGIVHGLQTDRWGIGSDVTAAAARLEHVPEVIGDWTSTTREIPERELQIAGAVGSLSREYVNRIDGSTVNVMLLCGRPGPIAVHPPTVCFVGAGWSMSGPVEKLTQSAGGAPMGEFWRVNFVRDADGVPVRIRTLWSWSTDGDWQAADSPRRLFAGNGHLYKLYVTAPMPLEADSDESPATDEFLELFLPQLRSLLQ